MRKNPENRIVRMFWDDGVLDWLAGFGVILIGIAWYAMVFLVAGIEVAFRSIDPGWSIVVGGILMVVWGAWVFVRFLNRYHLTTA